MIRLTRVWAKDAPWGTELVHVTSNDGRLSATGVAIGTAPLPYRLEYEITTGESYVTKRLVVRARGEDWSRLLELERGAAGDWSCAIEVEGAPELRAPGGDLSVIGGALDCDLGLSPMTNSMPVLRHRLHEGGGCVDFLMAWVSVPDLVVSVSRQRYTFLRQEKASRVVRFDGLDDAFVAEIEFDDYGMVVNYPGIARRVR